MSFPSAGRVLHGVFPGGSNGDETAISASSLHAYEAAVGRRVGYVYFSSEWGSSTAFPHQNVAFVTGRGAVPVVRLMLRSTTDEDVPEPKYSLEKIAGGSFDELLLRWAKGAAATPFIVVDYGVEQNGSWFSWNGAFHNNSADVFVRAYRHIHEVMRRVAPNLLFAFHVNDQDSPDEGWNHFENYYPGDEFVDWVGFSAYGSVAPAEAGGLLSDTLRTLLPRLSGMAPGKPIFAFETGVSKSCPALEARHHFERGKGAARWADDALTSLLASPAIAGFSWWNEAYPSASGYTDMRVQHQPEVAKVFRSRLANPRVSP
jgi:hypothetical protein